ncbi:hypothetical protein XENTR_v10013544 [Xenopus tropicalis]|nr:hypothetical protein XENTR_v10013544 [Xenopus tropicalis]
MRSRCHIKASGGLAAVHKSLTADDILLALINSHSFKPRPALCSWEEQLLGLEKCPARGNQGCYNTIHSISQNNQW